MLRGRRFIELAGEHGAAPLERKYEGNFVICNRPFFGALACALIAPHVALATGQYSGRVTDIEGNPVAGIVVRAGYLVSSIFDVSFMAAGQAITSVDGDYEIDDLAGDPRPSGYILVADAPGFATVIYPDIPCYDPASCLLSITNPLLQYPAVGVDFVVSRAVGIAGRVDIATTGFPIANVSINLVHTESGSVIPRMTDNAGRYDAAGLQPGLYTASIDDPGDSLLPQVYAGIDFDGTMDQDAIQAGGTPLTLAEGQSATADFHLNTASHVAGTLASVLDGSPISASIEMLRLDARGDGTWRVVEEGTGTYSARVAPGSLKVRFSRFDEWVPQYYLLASDEASAQIVPVGSGESVGGIDAQLSPRQTIRGTITDAATHQPLAGVHVQGSVQGAIGWWLPVADALSDPGGHYLLQGLDAATAYRVATTGTPRYVDQAYADAIMLAADENRTGIDLPLAAGAYASGRIYDVETGAPPSYATVMLVDSSTLEVTGGASASSDGSYQSPAVLPGIYYVVASMPGHQFAWPDVPCGSVCDYTQAQTVTFDQPVEYPRIDFALPGIDLILRSGFENPQGSGKPRLDRDTARSH